MPGKCPAIRIPAPALSPVFFRNGFEMSKRLGCDFVHLLMVMNFEGAGVNPGACNPYGAYGLIQFTDLPGMGWGGSVDDFLHLQAEEQLPFVEKFLSAYKGSKLDSARRIHQALFLPATLSQGSDPDLVLCRKNGTGFKGQEAKFYSENAGLDHDGKGFITVGDLETADLKAAQSSRFHSILQGLKAAVPEANVPDKIQPAAMPVPSKPAVIVSTAVATVEGSPWASLAILAAVGIGGTLFLARENPYGIAGRIVHGVLPGMHHAITGGVTRRLA